MFIAIAFSLLIAAACGLALGLIIQLTRLNDPTLININGKTFRDRRVTIDGKLFTNCQFHNVRFVWKGGMGLLGGGCKVYGGSRIEPGNELARATLGLFRNIAVGDPPQEVLPHNVVRLSARRR